MATPSAGTATAHPADTGADAAGLITEAVLRNLAGTPDARLREVMTSLVSHLHAFAREVQLTEQEWMAGIQFLTAVGQKCTPTRQEFILLSDTHGLSSLVDVLTQNKPAGATESTVLGPFYVPASTERANGESMAEEDDATPAVVRGRVLALDGTPIPGATIDLWQTNSKGFYAVQEPDSQPPQNLRGRYRTDADGCYELVTVRPVEYPIPTDGPVGDLLRAEQRHPWRAAHIHAIVSAPGYERVVTHIFDGERDYLDSDAVFGVKASLIRTFSPGTGPDGKPIFELDHDFVLAPER
ncbi:MAG: intradiol ring-cleavage dioxygenase [Acidimicrobiales bacterium]